MTEDFGDDDDVDADAEQVGGHPEDVGGQGEVACFVDDAGVGGEFVHELVDGPGGEPSAASVEEQHRAVCAGPGGAFGPPFGERGPGSGVDERDLAGCLALA
nr:hypothetical protein OG999_02030 [Streptomyces sp. NBC_00886]